MREYIVNVFADIASHYDIDGLHLDYIRFPNEPPAVPKGSGLDYPRDERTLNLYKEETGLTPDENQEAWDRWRTDQVTKLVADIHAMLRSTRPQAALSAAVSSVRKQALHHFQDGRRWMDDGIIDILILMNYTDEPKTFANWIDPWIAVESETPLVPGLWFGRHKTKSIKRAAGVVKEQIEIAREKTGNFCVFAYSSLFDSSDEELSKQNERESGVRKIRRDVLLEYLQSLPDEK